MSGLELKYFVLKPKGNDAYAKASRSAIACYATHIRKENKQLSNDLWEWVEREQRKADGIVSITDN